MTLDNDPKGNCEKAASLLLSAWFYTLDKTTIQSYLVGCCPISDLFGNKISGK